MCEMIEGLDGTEVIVDDILEWGNDSEEHDQRLKKLFERAEEWYVRTKFIEMSVLKRSN